MGQRRQRIATESLLCFGAIEKYPLDMRVLREEAGDAAVLFERTVSRLIEMRSEAYIESRTERAATLEATARTAEPAARPA